MSSFDLTMDAISDGVLEGGAAQLPPDKVRVVWDKVTHAEEFNAPGRTLHAY